MGSSWKRAELHSGGAVPWEEEDINCMVLLHVGQVVANSWGFWLFLVWSFPAWAGTGEVIRAAWEGWQVSLAAPELSPGALHGVSPEDKAIETSTSFVRSGMSSPPDPANGGFSVLPFLGEDAAASRRRMSQKRWP